MGASGKNGDGRPRVRAALYERVSGSEQEEWQTIRTQHYHLTRH